MRARKIFSGERVRQLRLAQGQSQAALARLLGLSPSYLSQIEADLRPLPKPLAARLAAHFGVPAAHFADAEEMRLAARLREAAALPLPGAAPIAPPEAEALARAAPGFAERFLALEAAYRALAEAQAASLPAAPVPYDAVGDWVQAEGNYFDTLDRLAEDTAARIGLGAAPPHEALARHLRDQHRITLREAPDLLASGTLWRLDRAAGQLAIAEQAAETSRSFWLAHIIGQIEQSRAIAHAAEAARFASDEATALARIALGNYFAGALLMPYGRFLAEARRLRYDVEQLQGAFGASFEQVCHRLSTLQRAGARGIAFFFVKTDIAGNILKRSSANRFGFARSGGSCPLWGVFRAFGQPGRLIVQLARAADESRYLIIARTVGRSGGAYLSRHRNVAVMMGCAVSEARETVYSTGLDLRDDAIADPVGPGCRACARMECRHRAVPPAGRPLDVGSLERGLVPYRIRP